MEKQGGVANRILISLSNRFPILLFVGCFCDNNADRPFLQITVPCLPSCDAANNCVSSRFSGQRLDSVRVHTATCSLWMYSRVESAWSLLCIPGQTGRAGERILGAPSRREFVLRHDWPACSNKCSFSSCPGLCCPQRSHVGHPRSGTLRRAEKQEAHKGKRAF